MLKTGNRVGDEAGDEARQGFIQKILSGVEVGVILSLTVPPPPKGRTWILVAFLGEISHSVL